MSSLLRAVTSIFTKSGTTNGRRPLPFAQYKSSAPEEPATPVELAEPEAHDEGDPPEFLRSHMHRTHEPAMYNDSISVNSSPHEHNPAQGQWPTERQGTSGRQLSSNLPGHGLGINTVIDPITVVDSPGYLLQDMPFLTGTEQANLLRAFNDLREINLNRKIVCPFDGCSSFNTSNESSLILHHYRTAHGADTCSSCGSHNSLFDFYEPVFEDHSHCEMTSEGSVIDAQRLSRESAPSPRSPVGRPQPTLSAKNKKRPRPLHLCDEESADSPIPTSPNREEDVPESSEPSTNPLHKNLSRKRRRLSDPAYNPSEDGSGSSDEIEPDVDDLSTPKRRNTQDPAYNPKKDGPVSSEEEKEETITPAKTKAPPKKKATSKKKAAAPKKKAPAKAPAKSRATRSEVVETVPGEVEKCSTSDNADESAHTVAPAPSPAQVPVGKNKADPKKKSVGGRANKTSTVVDTTFRRETRSQTASRRARGEHVNLML